MTELDDLRAQLEESQQLARLREAQLEAYAKDLSETFKQERERSIELAASYAATVRALANAVEARDAYTGKHAERVAAYGLELAAVLGLKLADDPQMEFGFLLHDIGKVAIPDSVLFKPEPLSNEEYALMRRHTVIGWEILREISFLGDAKLVVRHHHERWDGAGYPDGLAGEDIPQAARIFCVADTLDALTTNRPYRQALSWAVAREELCRHAGTQFDPEVIEAFRAVSDERFTAIQEAVG